MRKDKYQNYSKSTLEDHSKRKHNVLCSYFHKYLEIRTSYRQQRKLRLALVDGFAGAGLYKDGEPGSPLILLKVLKDFTIQKNKERQEHNLPAIEVECLLILNDKNQNHIAQLKRNIQPLEQEVADIVQLNVNFLFKTTEFERLYPEIKNKILGDKYNNVIFNLDQYASQGVSRETLRDIMQSFKSPEILLTYSIQARLRGQSKLIPKEEQALIQKLEQQGKTLENLNINRDDLLGKIERSVFQDFKNSAGYIAPFNINSPGYRLWLVHFTNFYLGRRAYNDVLHNNASHLIHHGRSGLEMLSYENDKGQRYLFDSLAREESRLLLPDDIARYVDKEPEKAMKVRDLYAQTYSETPAHSEDIDNAIIENPDIEVRTDSGGKRRVPNQIDPKDTIILKPQRFFQFIKRR